MFYLLDYQMPMQKIYLLLDNLDQLLDLNTNFVAVLLLFIDIYCN